MDVCGSNSVGDGNEVKKHFSIFEKIKMRNNLKDLPKSGEMGTSKLDTKLLARRSARLKSEVFVECMPVVSLNNSYDITKEEFVNEKIDHRPQEDKVELVKSPNFMERIDKYSNIQVPESSNTEKKQLAHNSMTSVAKEDRKEAQSKQSKILPNNAMGKPKTLHEPTQKNFQMTLKIDDKELSHMRATVNKNVINVNASDNSPSSVIQRRNDIISGRVPNVRRSIRVGAKIGTKLKENVSPETKKNSSTKNNSLEKIQVISDPQIGVENETNTSLVVYKESPKKRGRKPKISKTQLTNDNSTNIISNNAMETTDILDIVNTSNLPQDIQKSIKKKTSNLLSKSSEGSLKKRGRKPKTVDIIKEPKTKSKQRIGIQSKQLDLVIESRAEDCDLQIINKNCKTFSMSKRTPNKRNRNLQSNDQQLVALKSNEITDSNVNCELPENINTENKKSTKSNLDMTLKNAINKNDTKKFLKTNKDVQKPIIESIQAKKRGRKSKSNSTTSMEDISATDKDLNKNNNTDKPDNDLSQAIEKPKIKRGRPRSVNSCNQIEKQIKTAPRQARKMNTTKVRKKLSKGKVNSVNIRKIPKDRLDEVLDMLANEDHPIWEDRNISCNAGIHRHWETRLTTSDQNIKLKYARQFLLRRDWISLSKVLCLSNQDSKNNFYYPLLVKYAALCLAHTDSEQFHKFVKFLTNMDDIGDVIKKCTKMSRRNKV